MSIRRVISLAAVAALGIALVSADAFAARVAVRGGAVGVRGGAIGVRGGAIGVRGGAVGVRGGLYGRGYYRPGLGLAAGAVVGGAIAASQPGYGYGGYGYDSGTYGYNPGYTAASYATPVSYGNSSYAGGCTSDPIMCNSQCWLNTSNGNYGWADCPKAKIIPKH
jgi:hypothetical protein